ncbi:hypothetical protein ACN27F_22700 [Solwaraspora sp. WMMB335]|uniref:hypothetical protein n=1 Tax=Solwaraspora sp. WMMB335 TaxID=3404118 RepID=UPI003B94AFB7
MTGAESTRDTVPGRPVAGSDPTARPGSTPGPASVAELTRVVDLLVRQVAHWEAARWASGDGRRAVVFHQLVQRIADLGAIAENRPGRPVPRLPHDTALPDQLRVVTADLIRVEPSTALLATAVAAVTEARGRL